MSSWINTRSTIRRYVLKHNQQDNINTNSVYSTSNIINNINHNVNTTQTTTHNVASSHVYKKIKNIAYFISHSGLFESEVVVLKKLGYHLYIPISKTSIEQDITNIRNIKLLDKELDVLDMYNPLCEEEPSDEVIHIIKNNFDIIFVSVVNMKLIHKLALQTNKPIIIRIFGRDGNYNYYDYYEQIKQYNNVYFGMAYKEILDLEPKESHHKYLFLPLPMNHYYDSYINTWNGDNNKLMFVCSHIEESPYYMDIYKSFKNNFSNFLYTIYGKHGVFSGSNKVGEIIKNDPTIVPNLSNEEFTQALQNNKVLFYHSIEKRHVHYHPIEATTVGMPVIFMAGSLFDSLTNNSSSGRAVTIEEAKIKIQRIMNNDTAFCKKVVSDNRIIFEKMSDDNYSKCLYSVLEQLKINKLNVCLIPHYGLGDIICMIPVINYLAEYYNKIKVVCLSHNVNNFKSFFIDNPNISYIIPKNESKNIMSNYPFNEELHQDELYDCDILRCGLHYESFNKKHNIIISPIRHPNPYHSFDNINIPYTVFWKYFKIPDNNDNNNLYKLLKFSGIPEYIFLHTSTSDEKLDYYDKKWLLSKYNIDSNVTLVINPNMNIYNSKHYFHKIAEQFVNKPILQYKELLINASSIFVTNSAFFCLAIHLNLNAKYKIVFKRNNASVKYIWCLESGCTNINYFTEI